MPNNFDTLDSHSFLNSAGSCIEGAEMKILGKDEGEICYRGRHIFMGYYK